MTLSTGQQPGEAVSPSSMGGKMRSPLDPLEQNEPRVKTTLWVASALFLKIITEKPMCTFHF